MLDTSYIYEITSGEIGLTIATVGLLGNIFSIIIWSRISNRPRNGKGDQTPACAAYFLAMAVIDSGLLVSFIAGESLPVFLVVLKKSLTFARLYSFFIFPLYSFFLCSSIWIVIAVTVHRFLFVIHGKMFSFKKNIVTIIIINIVGFLTQLPNFFYFRPVFEVENNHTEGYWTYNITDFANSKSFTDYLFWLDCIFVILLAPLIIILILNTILLHNIIKSNHSISKNLSNQGSRMKKNRKMTITILTVTTSFFVLLLWQCIAHCFWLLGYHQDDPDKSIWNMVDASYAASRLGVIIHSSVNCPLYYVSGPLFRREVSKLFGRNKIKKTAPPTVEQSITNTSTC